MEYWLAAALAIVAFAMGSVPFGYLVGKMNGVDVRKHGSGNIGATNVGRVCGKRWGYLVLFLDFMKAWCAVFLLTRLALAWEWDGDEEMLRVIFGVSAVLGHNFCPWLGFKGGKGVASTAGILVGINPLVFVIAFAVFLLVFLMSHYVSLGSILSAVAMATSVWVLAPGGWAAWAITVLAILAIWKHRSNIKRLMQGTESKTPPPWASKNKDCAG